MLWFLAQCFLGHCDVHWVASLHGIFGFVNQMCLQGRDNLFEQARHGLFQIILALSQVVCSEGCCFLLKHLELACCPVLN
jgi:hypothetical protein